MDDLISKLSEIRSNYNCFNADEEPYYRALSETIKKLSERSDEDTISRQTALDAIMGQPSEPHYPSWYAAQIEELPVAQPEHKTGRWTFGFNNQYLEKYYYCSNCGFRKYTEDEPLDNFCSKCGADMRGGEKE